MKIKDVNKLSSLIDLFDYKDVSNDVVSKCIKLFKTLKIASEEHQEIAVKIMESHGAKKVSNGYSFEEMEKESVEKMLFNLQDLEQKDIEIDTKILPRNTLNKIINLGYKKILDKKDGPEVLILKYSTSEMLLLEDSLSIDEIK